MCPVKIEEMTSHVRAIDRAVIDPKLQAFLRKTCAEIAQLESVRKDGDATDDAGSERLVKAFKAAAKAAGDLLDRCDEVEHEAAVKAMEWITGAARERVKEIAAEDARRRRDAESR